MGHVDGDAVEWDETEREEMHVRRKELGAAADGERLGCSLYELPAGARSWPYHYHTANEEAMYVLAGAGQVRLADEVVAVDAGDYLAFPADASGAHRVVNDSEAPLRYLAFSTMDDPDMTVYPDSGKFGVFVGSPPGGREERSLHGYYRMADDVDYWEGED
jgi:uncharacterized cupin superfamily protein